MAKLTDFKLLSFDVYGTIIDWETGVLTALQPLLEKNGKPDMDRQELLRVQDRIESEQQAKTPDAKYFEVLTRVHPLVAEELKFEKPTAEENEAFGQSIGDWPPFPDSVDALKRLSQHFKMVVLSNVDNDSFQKSKTKQLQGFEFDAVLTAQDIGSYKPDLKNFEYMFRTVKERFGVEREQVLQTAQSQFHDHQPGKKLGMKTSWICRRGATMGNRDEPPKFDWKFDTLGDMADAVEKELEG
ncbi:HAD-like protein [Lophiostoma macrostomum CBS 122681]|uniref:HAD-like protein n=1 Tax=Lophiostoma macrostomum CBS 122681 TaxID=1314788 RepID=A0A6A6SK54_9PLEO|nr:HAD-like protein [Lophiostoma macrostomum CBS 122681]